MGIANKERFLPNHQVSKMARNASSAPTGGVDFGNWNVVDTKKILNNIKMTVGAVLVLGGLGTACGKPTEGTTQIPKTTPTVSPKPTDIPPSPTLEFKPTPTEVPTLAPTPTAVIEMGVSEMAIGGEETDILKPFDRIVRVQISKNDFESKNSGLTLLVPQGETSQAIVQFQKDDQTWILGNFNLPVFKEGQVEFQPQFNTPDFVFLMGWVDNQGRWLYHVPLMPGEEGKAPVVYQRDNQLYQGLVDLATGKIDPASEKPYWQEMPQEAVKAVMAKYGDAVYVTFWDRDGKQLEGERIKVCDLPPEPTPIPTPTPTPEPTPTPTPICGELTLKPDQKAYIRTGPGTNYPILETFDPNEKFLVKYQAPGGGWMYGDLVDANGNVKRTGVWVTGSDKYVSITCGKEGIPVIPQEQIPPTPTPRATETPKPAENILTVGQLTIENGNNTYRVVLNEKRYGGYWPDGTLKGLLEDFFDGNPMRIRIKIVDQPDQLPMAGRPTQLWGSTVIVGVRAYCDVYDPQTPDTYWLYFYPEYSNVWLIDPAAPSYNIVAILNSFLQRLGVMDDEERTRLWSQYSGAPEIGCPCPPGEGILKVVKR